MDARLINPVLTTIVNVLSTMANVQASMGKPELKQNEESLGEVTGLMSMNSSKVRASLAISKPYSILSNACWVRKSPNSTIRPRI